MIKIFITFLVAFAGVFSTYNFVPLKYFEIFQGEPKLKAVITTINGTDTLKDSRSTINTNFTNLNTDISQLMATTSMNGITTLNNLTTAGSLATIGTITTGVWNGTAIGVAKGGTGTTTFSSNQVLLGDGSNGVKVVNGLGTAGYFLASQGAGLPPIWSVGGLDYTANFNWTGNNYFKNLFASSTQANPIYLNTVAYNTPSSQGASSTSLINDGSGNLKWQEPDWKLLFSSTTQNTVATSTFSFTSKENMQVMLYIPAITNNLYPTFQFNGDTGSNYDYYHGYSNTGDVNGAGQTVFRLTPASPGTTNLYLTMDILNLTTIYKQVKSTWEEGSDSGAGGVGYTGRGSANWRSNSAITSISIGVTGGLPAGTKIKIYGGN